MSDIAIVGMKVRLPGANNIDEFWENLIDGRDVISCLTDEELASSGVSSEKIRDSNYVKRAGLIDNIEIFDAEFFEYAPKEAELIDPQARILLELSWEALESSGCAGEIKSKNIGVYASSGINYYLLNNILSNKAKFKYNFQEVIISNAPDCLATRIAYKFGLRGPSLTIQSGCSASLVALHHARVALLTKQCDAVVVAAASIHLPQKEGYSYIPEGFLSHDGTCRPFSDNADGTIFTSGAAAIVLKRLDDALKMRNPIYSVVKSSSINNDGNDKAGFTAPSVNGQAEVIAKAQRIAGINVENISYIEAHGTATPIGDPIEIEALMKAFRLNTDKKQFCALGSVKSNIGHTDVTAGLAGLIKTSLALKKGVIPSTLHYQNPNPRIDFAKTPFFVCTKNQDWTQINNKRYAGISSFGFGGTNGHVILESPPSLPTKPNKENPDTPQLIIFSAKNDTLLQEVAKNLASYLESNRSLNLNDIAYTLQLGRSHFKCRYGFICNTISEAISEFKKVAKQLKTKRAIHYDNKGLINYLERWINGDTLNFAKLHEKSNCQIIDLPTYPFQRKRFWIDVQESATDSRIPNKLIRADDSHSWFYTTVWRQDVFSSVNSSIKTILYFSDGSLETSRIISYLIKQGKKVIVILAGDKFTEHTDNSFSLCPAKKQHYLELLNLLKARSLNQFHIIYQWVLDDKLDAYSGFFSILFFMQALISIDVKLCKKIDIITRLSCSVLGNENILPFNATYHALTRSIQQEYTHIKARCIDVAEVDSEVTSLLSREVSSDSQIDIVALRGSYRWVQQYNNHKLCQNKADAIFEHGGVYVIIGGLGNVGLVHAEFLAKHYDASLILVGRSKFPVQTEWDFITNNEKNNKELVNKIRILQNIKHYGSKILLKRADVSNIDQMQEVFDSGLAKFGKITGVIHSAGAKGELHYKPLSQISKNYIDQILSPKIDGINVIFSLVKKYNIDTCFVVSSISSILAGLGLCVYSASHNYLNAFAQLNKSSCKWYVINWEAWNFHMNSSIALDRKNAIGNDIDKFTLSREDGMQVLFNLSNINSGFDYTVSTCDLASRHRYWVLKKFEDKNSSAQARFQKRPNLPTPYVKPNNKTERVILDMWQNLLGILEIGIKDNFFELGGHSLLALEMISKVNKELKGDVSIIDLFNNPTVEKMSKLFLKNDVQGVFLGEIKKRAKQQRLAIFNKD